MLYFTLPKDLHYTIYGKDQGVAMAIDSVPPNVYAVIDLA